MNAREFFRPGGRSARVQAAVHDAVNSLMAEMPRDQLSFPLIAARAGVTPSTLYRRWGDLAQLLGDVALERIRPQTDPLDTGSLTTDLEAWTEQFVEEMSSVPGRTMLRDVLTVSDDARTACACADITRSQLELLRDRALQRGQAGIDVEPLMDHLVAPIVYRILYGMPLDPEYAHGLLKKCLKAQVISAD